MPQLPRYNEPMVNRQQAPVANLNMRALNPTQGLAQGIDTATQVMGQAIAQADKVRLDDFQNKLAVLDAQHKAEVLKKQGEQALKPDTDGNDPFHGLRQSRQEAVEVLLSELGNDRQKAEAKRLSAHYGAQLDQYIIGHQSQEQKAFESSVFEGRIKTTGMIVASDPLNDNVFNEQVAQRDDAVRSRFKGMAPEAIDAKVAEATSDIFATRLRELTKVNVVKAKDLLDKFPDALVGDDRKQIEHEVNMKFTATAGNAIATAHFDFKGSKAEQAAAIRNDPAAKGNPDVIQAALRIHDGQWSDAVFDRNEKIARVEDQVDGWMMGMSPRDRDKLIRTEGVYQQALLLGEDESTAKKLQKYWEADAMTRENQALQRQAHARAAANYISPEQHRKNEDAIDTLLANPQAFMELPRSGPDLTNLRAQLPWDRWAQVLAFKRRLEQDPQALRDATVDATQVADALAKGGYIHDANPTGDAEKAVLKSAQAYVVQQLNAWRSDNRGAPLTPEIRAKTLGEAVEKIRVGKSLLGFDILKPRFQASETELLGVPSDFAEAYIKNIGNVPPRAMAQAFRDNPNLFAPRSSSKSHRDPFVSAPASGAPPSPFAVSPAPRKESK